MSTGRERCMPTAFEQAVYRTVAYFDAFRYPLTAFEIWKFLLEPQEAVTLHQVRELLSSSPFLRKRFIAWRGFYSLRDTPEFVRERGVRFVDAVRKYRKAVWYARLIARLPYVRSIAICNSLAFFHTNKESDIDLFIVSEPGRVWTTRLLTTLPARLFRLRPGEAKRDPICLSFFADEKHLPCASLKAQERDPYLAYWLATLVPLYGDAVFRKLREENAWVREALPHVEAVRVCTQYQKPVRFVWPWAFFKERFARKVQEHRLPPEIVRIMNVDTRVVVHDGMLKFHENDRRAYYAAKLRRHEERAFS